jgi:hypothetical protein
MNWRHPDKNPRVVLAGLLILAVALVDWRGVPPGGVACMYQ